MNQGGFFNPFNMNTETLKEVIKELHSILNTSLSYYKNIKGAFLAQAKVKTLSHKQCEALSKAGYCYTIEVKQDYLLITIN